MRKRPPDLDGLAASTLQLPPGAWATVLDCLCDRFPAVPRPAWLDRMARGRVLDDDGRWISPRTPFRVGLEIHYYREIADEPHIPFGEAVLHADEHLLVADKPHFLPVTPAGAHVHETLLGRLIRRTGNPDLVPLHRIDRETAGLVLFSTNPKTRGRYQALFRERLIRKDYEAIAPALPGLGFPCVRTSRIVAGDPFFRMQENGGPPNSETRIDVIERGERNWRYALAPVTGRKHQLRVHMAALGAPIANDRLYPSVDHRPRATIRRPCSCWRSGWISPTRPAASSAVSPVVLCSTPEWDRRQSGQAGRRGRPAPELSSPARRRARRRFHAVRRRWRRRSGGCAGVH